MKDRYKEPHTCVESPSGEAGPRYDLSRLSDAAKAVVDAYDRDEQQFTPIVERLRDALAAPPSAGALHPLPWPALLDAVAELLVAWDVTDTSLEPAIERLRAAWDSATAAPPTLSAEELKAADVLLEAARRVHGFYARGEVPLGAMADLERAMTGYENPWLGTFDAARAPVTPTPEPYRGPDYPLPPLPAAVFDKLVEDARGEPEPATVEGPHPWYGPCDAFGTGFTMTTQNGACSECERLARDTYPNAWPAVAPARPPAVTRTLSPDDLRTIATMATMLFVGPGRDDWNAVDREGCAKEAHRMFMAVLDEDEARRDADRRGRE